MYAHILVPTDGSEIAQNGVNHALSLAKALGSKVTVITSTEPFPIIYGREWRPSPAELERFEEENGKAADEVISKVLSDADKMGVQAELLHVRNEFAGTAIVDAAKDLGCDLIVMSSHGRSGVTRLLLGSQTSKVLANSTIPVLVVK